MYSDMFEFVNYWTLSFNNLHTLLTIFMSFVSYSMFNKKKFKSKTLIKCAFAL